VPQNRWSRPIRALRVRLRRPPFTSGEDPRWESTETFRVHTIRCVNMIRRPMTSSRGTIDKAVLKFIQSIELRYQVFTKLNAAHRHHRYSQVSCFIHHGLWDNRDCVPLHRSVGGGDGVTAFGATASVSRARAGSRSRSSGLAPTRLVSRRSFAASPEPIKAS